MWQNEVSGLQIYFVIVQRINNPDWLRCGIGKDNIQQRIPSKRHFHASSIIIWQSTVRFANALPIDRITATEKLPFASPERDADCT